VEHPQHRIQSMKRPEAGFMGSGPQAIYQRLFSSIYLFSHLALFFHDLSRVL